MFHFERLLTKTICLVFILKSFCFLNISTQTFGNQNKNKPSILDANFHNVNHFQNIFEDSMSKILSNNWGKDFVIHFESLSSDFIENVITKHQINKMNKPVLLILNYDNFKKSHENVIKMSQLTVHIVSLMHPVKFEIINNKNLKANDVVVFVCQRQYRTCENAFQRNETDLTTDFLKDLQTLSTVQVVLVIEFQTDRLRLYEVCHFCGERSDVLTLKYETNLQPSNSIDNLVSEIGNMFDKKYLDFNSHTFRVAFHYRGLNFICKNPTNLSMEGDAMIVHCPETESLEGNMLREMSKRMNFKFKLVNYEHKLGPVRETLVDTVNQSMADFAVGSITLTKLRWEKADFSVSVLEDPCIVLYNVQSSFFKEGLMLVYVFTSLTWIAILVALVLQSIIVYLNNKLSRSERNQPFHKVIWDVGFLLAEQAKQGDLTGGRSLIIWLLCCSIISSLYKAELSSFITKPPTDSLKKFDQLVKEGYDLNLIKSRFIISVLNSSSDKSFQELSRRVTFSQQICPTLHAFIGKKQMIIEEADSLYDASIKYCKGVLTDSDKNAIRVTPDSVLHSTHSWVYKKGTPYLKYMDAYILRLHENGLQKKWSEKLIIPPKDSGINFDGRQVMDDSETRKNTFYGQFVLWIIGVAISSVCFICEVLVFYLKRPHNLIIA